MNDIVGGVFAAIMGVIVIAGIYQLNKKGSPIVPATQNVAVATLTSIFK